MYPIHYRREAEEEERIKVMTHIFALRRIQFRDFKKELRRCHQNSFKKSLNP